MRIYTLILAVFVSLFINIVLNILIFVHVRNSTHRVQPQMTNTNANRENNQQPRIGRREISLLKQMIFMFSMFIGGWTPIYSIVIINQYLNFTELIFHCSLIVAELAVLAIIINLFKCNHEIRQYLFNKIRQYIRL
jgi:hypothetical protein